MKSGGNSGNGISGREATRKVGFNPSDLHEMLGIDFSVPKGLQYSLFL